MKIKRELPLLIFFYCINTLLEINALPSNSNSKNSTVDLENSDLLEYVLKKLRQASLKIEKDLFEDTQTENSKVKNVQREKNDKGLTEEKVIKTLDYVTKLLSKIRHVMNGQENIHPKSKNNIKSTGNAKKPRIGDEKKPETELNRRLLAVSPKTTIKGRKISNKNLNEEISNRLDINKKNSALALTQEEDSPIAFRSFVGDMINSNIYGIIEYVADIIKNFVTSLLSKLFNFGFGGADMILYVGMALVIGIASGIVSGLGMLIGTGFVRSISFNRYPASVRNVVTAPFRYLFQDILGIVNDLNFGVIFKKLYNILLSIYRRVVSKERLL